MEISAKQLQIVREYMSELLEQEVQNQEDNTAVSTQLEVSQQVYTYVQLDGHRGADASFKFLSKRHMPKIPHSEYVAYLGDAATFLKRFERYVPAVQCPIFIADGAPWIWPQWNWSG